jgi:hypothetical protein
MKYSYEIIPHPVELRGGWRLMMLQDGGVFPIVPHNPEAGVTWRHGCSEPGRGHRSGGSGLTNIHKLVSSLFLAIRETEPIYVCST